MQGRITVNGRLVRIRPRVESDLKYRPTSDRAATGQEPAYRFGHEERSPDEYRLSIETVGGEYVGELAAFRVGGSWQRVELRVVVSQVGFRDDGSVAEGLRLFLGHIRDELGVERVRADVERSDRAAAGWFRTLGFELEEVGRKASRLELVFAEAPGEW